MLSVVKRENITKNAVYMFQEIISVIKCKRDKNLYVEISKTNCYLKVVLFWCCIFSSTTKATNTRFRYLTNGLIFNHNINKCNI